MKKLSALVFVTTLFTLSTFAQEAQLRKLADGQKYKLKGVVVAKDDASLVLRDATGVDTRVVVTSSTSIKAKGGFLSGGDTVPMTQVVRGLNLETEGRGDREGNLSAVKIQFTKTDLKTAQSIESRVGPAEDRLTASEQNAQRLSGQVDELMTISNTTRGEVKTAQTTADAAVEGVNATNQRISTLDDYTVNSSVTVTFKVNSAILSPEAKVQLDQLATAALQLRGYTVEVTGFASADGDAAKNKLLSKNRAQAVIDYLVETHNVDLRRFSQSYGFGAGRPVGDNLTKEGREQNRRVEVRLLVSKGLNQNVEVKPAPKQIQ